MARNRITVGIFADVIPGRNNIFTSDQLARARRTGAYAFAAKMRGWTTEELDADFNGTRFREFINDKQGRRTIAANLAKLADSEFADAVARGHLDLIAASGGTRVEYWERVRRDGYKAGPGWKNH